MDDNFSEKSDTPATESQPIEPMADKQVETRQELQAHGGSLTRNKLKIDPIAAQAYGEEHFIGYQKVAEITDLIPAFKEYYYQEKIKNPQAALYPMLREFNETVLYPEGRKFHPYPTQVRFWRKKWDIDIMNQRSESDKELVIYEPKRIKQVIKTRGEDGELIYGGPSEGDLEGGARSLAGELINDAAQMLRDDQELEDMYTTADLVKRKQYVVNVLAHVTKLVHGKAALMLKASEEKRNNTNFLMNLLAKASAGTLSDDEMDALGAAYGVKQATNEHVAV